MLDRPNLGRSRLDQKDPEKGEILHWGGGRDHPRRTRADVRCRKLTGRQGSLRGRQGNRTSERHENVAMMVRAGRGVRASRVATQRTLGVNERGGRSRKGSIVTR